jgi:hypothetical protein
MNTLRSTVLNAILDSLGYYQRGLRARPLEFSKLRLIVGLRLPQLYGLKISIENITYYLHEITVVLGTQIWGETPWIEYYTIHTDRG